MADEEKLEKGKIADIIKSCGGTMKVAMFFSLNYNTILAWRRNQHIPEKYWEAIIKKSSLDLTVEDLYLAE